MNCIRAFTMTTASLLSLGLALFCGDAAAQSAKSAHFGDAEHPDRLIVNAQIGAS